MRGNHFPFLFTAGVIFKRGSFLFMLNMKKNKPWVLSNYSTARGGGSLFYVEKWSFLQGSLLFFTPQMPEKLRLSNLRFEKNFSKNILCQIKYSTVLYNSLSNTNSVSLKTKFYIHTQIKNDGARLFAYMWICL